MKFQISSIAICLLLYSASIFSQNYEFNSSNSFNISLEANEGESLVGFQFVDYDFDGDFDLLSLGFIIDTSALALNVYAFQFFQEISENIGTIYEPTFSPKVKILPNLSYPKGLSLISYGDLDTNKEMDLVISADSDTITGFQNLFFYYSANAPEEQFQLFCSEEIGLDPLSPWSILFPKLIDIDSDGDLDLILYGNVTKKLYVADYTQSVLLAENIGTAASPEFIGWYNFPYHIKTDTLTEFLEFGDLDLDGDIDVLSLIQNEDGSSFLGFKENIPDEYGNPYFLEALASPFGLPRFDDTTSIGIPNLVDIDGDGDLDLFIPVEGEIHFYKNVDCTPEQTELHISICEGESYLFGDSEYSTAGHYQEVFQNLRGCDSTVNLFLSIIENTDTNISIDLCTGEQIEIGNEFFSQTGEFEIRLQDQYGCDSIINLEINVHEIDNAIQLIGDTLFAKEGYSSYQWYDCNTEEPLGSGENFFVPEISGSYLVIITNEFGCESYSECLDFMVNSTLEEDWSHLLELVPNPASQTLSILNKSERKIDRIEIYDLSGKLVSTKRNHLKSSIDISTYEAGIYWVKLFSDQMETLKKLLIL